MSLVLLGLVVTGLAFVTGALQAQVVGSDWRLSAYDASGQRRFALTVSSHERPDIALFNARGHRFVPGQ